MKTKKLVLCSLFMAIICVATLVIQVPSPMNGYVNLGDVFVLLAAWIMGPLYGLTAAGIGSMLADIITGYAYYAPATLIIKALVAYAAAYIVFGALKNVKLNFLHYLTAGLASEIIMVLGYFAYAGIILKNGLAAASSIPGNIVQAVVCTLIASWVIVLLKKYKITDKISE